MKTPSLTISFLFQVDVGNVNASWNEGVVQVLKKVERPDGQTHPYVSGQAIRHYFRSTASDLLASEDAMTYGEFSTTRAGEDSKAPVMTEGKPRKFIDDDLFGFMNATTKGTWKREAPLRVSPAYGLFPYHRDRDLGTRSAVEEKKSAEAGGSIFETEITNNIFRSTLLLELDRVGKWKSFESVDEKEGELDPDKKKKRINLVLSSIKYLWGGGRRTRLLSDLSPQFLVYARMSKKVPIFLTSLRVNYDNGRYLIDTKALKETVTDYKQDIEKLIIGSKSGFNGGPEQELKDVASLKGAKISTIGEAVDLMIQDINDLDFGA